MAGVAMVADVLNEIRRAYGEVEASRRAHELVRRLIARMIEDVIAESGRRLRALAPASVADIRAAAAPVVAFSSSMASADHDIKGFLYPRMYRHPRVLRIMGEAEGVVCDLFARYAAAPADLPAEWAQEVEQAEGREPMRRIADFIAGMTDRYALVEHARLFEHSPDLR
jgi:dGTPase